MTLNNGPELPTPPLDDSLRAGLAILRRAHLYAQDAGEDRWDFALEIDKLHDAGVTLTDLRWLVAKSYAEHGQETSVYGDAHRSFKASGGLNFTPTTCFVLTPTGVAFADKALKDSAAG